MKGTWNFDGRWCYVGVYGDNYQLACEAQTEFCGLGMGIVSWDLAAQLYLSKYCW